MEPVTMHRPRHYYGTLHSHSRPIVHHPELLAADKPNTRVITQEEKKRIPYEPTQDPTI
jgi:hypothetical protein